MSIKRSKKKGIYYIINFAKKSKWNNKNKLLRLKMFSNTCCGVSSLNGGIPVMNSNRHTPSDHQSTAAPCFWLKKFEKIKNIQQFIKWLHFFRMEKRKKHFLFTRVKVLDLDSRVCPKYVHSTQPDCVEPILVYGMVSVSILVYRQPLIGDMLNWSVTLRAPDKNPSNKKEWKFRI